VRQAYLFATLLVLGLLALQPSLGQDASSPETSFLSRNQYTNAFFGFSLPLPTDPPFEEATLPSNRGLDHVLLYVQTLTASFNYKPRLTLFLISAAESKDLSSDVVRKAATGPQNADPKRVEIAGREFWRTAVEEKDTSGKTYTVKFATAANGYILTFLVTSFDGRLTGRLERNIERIKFFDPTKAREVAGATSKPYRPGSWPQELR
jgi:hypothetical protein